MTTEEIFKVKKVEASDYEMLNSWYESWGFKAIAQEGVLPECGLIIEYDGVGVIAGFLYLTDSCFAHPEWIVTNKQFKNKKIRKIAFKKLFQEFENYLKMLNSSSENLTFMIMSVKNNFLIKSLEGIGFEKTDTNMTNLLKRVTWQPQQQ